MPNTRLILSSPKSSQASWGLLILLLMTSVATGQWGDRSFENSGNADWERRWDSHGGWVNSGSYDRDWHLGVIGTNIDVGVVVQSLESNSPATQAGIRRGDIIVCVGHDRIGRVGNQIYDLDEEIDRHADSAGRVQLLVQPGGTGPLRNINVQLANRPSGLRGRLLIEGISLPTDATVTLRLENVTRPNYQVRNGEYTFRPSSYNRREIPFQLSFDPAYISQSDNYRLQAYVVSRGRTIMVAEQAPLVLTRGNPSVVDVRLRPTTYYDQTYGRPTQYTGTMIPVTDYRDEIIKAYREYLDRYPTNVELAAWQQSSEIDWGSGRLPIELLATQEYYNRAGGNDRAWIDRSFTAIVGRPPTSSELTNWLRRFGEVRYSRTELLRQLVMQARG